MHVYRTILVLLVLAIGSDFSPAFAQDNANHIRLYDPIPLDKMGPPQLLYLGLAKQKRERFLSDTFAYLELVAKSREVIGKAIALDRQGKESEALAALAEIEIIRPVEDIPLVDLISVYSVLNGKTGNTQKQLALRGLIFGIVQAIAHSGDGLSPETAVHVIATLEEYGWLRDKKLTLVKQHLLERGNEKFDVLTAKDFNGLEKDFYFNITRMYDKYTQGLVPAASREVAPPQKKTFPPPSDYVPLDQIKIKPKFESIWLTKENLAAEHKKCVPFIQENTESMNTAVREFPRNNATIAVGHSSSSKQFIYRGSTGLCLEFSANRYPIYAAETFIGTANPTGVPPDVTDDWYMKIALKIATGGRAKVAYVTDKGTAFLVSYWSDQTGGFALNYWSEFKKAGEWENSEVDYKFTNPALQGFSETKRGKSKNMVKSFPLAADQ